MKMGFMLEKMRGRPASHEWCLMLVAVLILPTGGDVQSQPLAYGTGNRRNSGSLRRKLRSFGAGRLAAGVDDGTMEEFHHRADKPSSPSRGLRRRQSQMKTDKVAGPTQRFQHGGAHGIVDLSSVLRQPS